MAARARTRRAALLAAGLLAGACAGTPAPEPTDPEPGAADSQPETAPPDANPLLELADRALAEGELAVARSRYERARRLNPRSLRALTGLGRVALAEGDAVSARRWLEAALARDPDASAARVGLAELALLEGDREQAQELLHAALRRRPGDARAHALLASTTGRAPPEPVRTLERAVERADAHPYDPRALLRAGALLAERGPQRPAAAYLKRVLWLADLDPPAAGEAARLLTGLAELWAWERVVPVHVLADEGVRARPGWRFELRSRWLEVSRSLREILGVRFVTTSIGEFRSAGSGPELESIHAGVWGRVRSAPPGGILAAFTGQPLPERAGERKRGLAEFAGRRTTLRLSDDPRADQRVLAHEILHLFGGIHVAADLESLMNPSGESLKLDPYNARIAAAMRPRRFQEGDPEKTIVPFVDLDELVEALSAGLGANLSFRRQGYAEALQAARSSRFEAAHRWRAASALDPHLADVSRFLARLSWVQGERVRAVELLEVAGQLYGPRTRRGRSARAHADALREQLERAYRP